MLGLKYICLLLLLHLFGQATAACKFNEDLCSDGTCAVFCKDKCFGKKECSDGSCVSHFDRCPGEACSFPKGNTCDNSDCYGNLDRCDGIRHCSDGTDERNCDSTVTAQASSSLFMPVIVGVVVLVGVIGVIILVVFLVARSRGGIGNGYMIGRGGGGRQNWRFGNARAAQQPMATTNIHYPVGNSMPPPPQGSYPTGPAPPPGSYPTGPAPPAGSYPTGSASATGAYPMGQVPAQGGYPTGNVPPPQAPQQGAYPYPQGPASHSTGQYPPPQANYPSHSPQPSAPPAAASAPPPSYNETVYKPMEEKP